MDYNFAANTMGLSKVDSSQLATSTATAIGKTATPTPPSTQAQTATASVPAPLDHAKLLEDTERSRLSNNLYLNNIGAFNAHTTLAMQALPLVDPASGPSEPMVRMTSVRNVATDASMAGKPPLLPPKTWWNKFTGSIASFVHSIGKPKAPPINFDMELPLKYKIVMANPALRARLEEACVDRLAGFELIAFKATEAFLALPKDKKDRAAFMEMAKKLDVNLPADMLARIERAKQPLPFNPTTATKLAQDVQDELVKLLQNDILNGMPRPKPVQFTDAELLAGMKNLPKAAA